MIDGQFKPLTDEDLQRIFEKYVNDRHRVSCCDYHAHGFDCVTFDDETTMIIERLRLEVVILRDKLKKNIRGH